MFIDEKAYEQSHPLRVSFADGQIAMCELLIGITQRMMIERKLTISRKKSDFESGQISAFESIISGCLGLLNHTKTEQTSDIKYDA